MKVKKICATTWFVYARDDGPKVGTINFPGETDRYQACRDGRIIGDFPELTAAARACFTCGKDSAASDERSNKP